MAAKREDWRELLRRTADYLEVLREGGFVYAEGKFEIHSAPPAPKPPKSSAPQRKPAQSALSPHDREALKAALTDPYAGLGNSGRGGLWQPVAPAPAASPTPSGHVARSSRPPAPPSPAPAQTVAAGGKHVTLRDHAEGAKTIAETTDVLRLEQLVSGCHMCGLAQGRTRTVYGTGSPRAELMFVGEGPGYHEDMQGKPFVGRAGALLTAMIQAMGLKRDDVFITNIVKCRPPGNRDPEPDEIKACEPFLKRQIDLIQPKLICALGRIAIQGLLRNTTPISKLRGKWQTYQGIPLMPTFHPAYLLRDPSQKRLAWEDLQAVMARMAEFRHGS